MLSTTLGPTLGVSGPKVSLLMGAAESCDSLPYGPKRSQPCAWLPGSHLPIWQEAAASDWNLDLFHLRSLWYWLSVLAHAGYVASYRLRDIGNSLFLSSPL